ncbi:MAG: AmmeMemoRadiSam system radical SAM enzyme [Treponema sp.]|nr:AmmeMemoRadiSam system radical SAM enzyme [Treponema sp.]MCL2251457.1 AmmeMemoRadiSam system radical SAM enzyme [Treponema sp.]
MNTLEFPPALRSPLFITETYNEVRCGLCPNYCEIKNGGFGVCGVRGNKGGKGIIPFYGFVSALAVDPIEKKPLYHFKPGSQILSLGFAGCNLRCPFCQNWHISQNTNISGKWIKPGEIISSALRQDIPSIAYTYSESLIHIEYLLDCMMLARRHGIANVLVTNGCVNHKAAVKVLKFADAVNIDLKSFSEETYKKHLGGDFKTILNFIELAYKMRVHIEITTLVVPELNASENELTSIADYIASIDKDIPWHLSAYHPEYRWNAPPTDPAFLLQTANNAKKKLTFVYTGNIVSSNDTYCSICSGALVKRNGYNVDLSGLINGNCAICGKTPKIVF